MTIEDVDFLKANSKKETYTFLIDSANRDYSAFPSPANYTVTFTQPFVNVVSFEVTDANIPRTMYNVDLYNNKLYFCIYNTLPSADIDPFIMLEVAPGDYTIDNLITALNAGLRSTVNGENASINVSTLSNPPELTNVLYFNCSYPFMFDMTRSTIATTLGFDLFVDSNESTKQKINLESPWKQMRYSTVPGYLNDPVYQFTLSDSRVLLGTYSIVKGGITKTDGTFIVAPQNTIVKQVPTRNVEWLCQNMRLYNCVSETPERILGQTSVIYNGPVGITRQITVTESTSVAQQFVIGTRGYLTQIQIALSGTIDTDTVHVSIMRDTSNNPDTTTVISQFDCVVSFTDGGYSTINCNNLLLTSGVYWIVVSNSATSSGTSSGTSSDSVGVYYNVTNSKLLFKTGNFSDGFVQMENFNMSMIITLKYPYNVMIAPSPYYLLGERYVILRCPEIEEHSYRYLAYSQHNLGLAKFRIDSVGYSQNLKLVKTDLREFHPIGKLNKITLQFYTRNDQFYDFKGINHDITFTVYYLEPLQKAVFKQSLLNPNYNGDYLSYVFKEDPEDDDEDDEDEDYRLAEMRHLALLREP